MKVKVVILSFSLYVGFDKYSINEVAEQTVYGHHKKSFSFHRLELFVKYFK